MLLQSDIDRLNSPGTDDPRAAGIKVPTGDEVCRVIETLYLLSDPNTVEEYRKFADDVYAFTHLQGNPSCLHAHQDWANQFWSLWESMTASGELRPPQEPTKGDAVAVPDTTTE